jgi:hypothetical protein
MEHLAVQWLQQSGQHRLLVWQIGQGCRYAEVSPAFEYQQIVVADA